MSRCNAAAYRIMLKNGTTPLPAPTKSIGPPSSIVQVKRPNGPRTWIKSPTLKSRTSRGEINPPGTSRTPTSMIDVAGNGDEATE